MGEAAVSSTIGDELVAIGLGSCIGLVITDRQAVVAGMAHVVLPTSGGKPGPAPKFADLAVTDLIAQVLAKGAVRQRLEAVMIGGAHMFSVGTSLDIGARNSAAVREELERERIRIVAEEIGGDRGRTARVVIGDAVSSQLAGGARTSLLALASPRAASPRPTVRAA